MPIQPELLPFLLASVFERTTGAVLIALGVRVAVERR